jgi:ElaB/YqjD/DUF883 family membrane-anchored ribosome-binding protein
MASTISRKRDQLVEELEDQVSGLKRELASLRRSASKRGGTVYDDVVDSAADLLEQFLRRGRGTGKSLAKQAQHAGDTMREYPVVATVVGVAVVGLLASLLLRR